MSEARWYKSRPRITFWRVVVTVILLMVIASFFDLFKYKGDHIARIEIMGLLSPDPPRHEMLQRLAKDDNVRALLVRIDSPGGAAGASEQIFTDLRNVAARKPVVALLGGVAASGGYVVALGADHILARPTTVTGSIGVILQWFDFQELAKKIGVKPYAIRSGDLKAQPDIFGQPSPKTKRHIKEIIQQTFNWFINLVARRRAMSEAKLIKIAGDGRIFTGKQALRLKLIDGLGGEKEALAWLASQHNIAPEMPIENYKPVDPEAGLRQWLFNKTLARMGLPLPQQIEQPLAPNGLMLLWQF